MTESDLYYEYCYVRVIIDLQSMIDPSVVHLEKIKFSPTLMLWRECMSLFNQNNYEKCTQFI